VRGHQVETVGEPQWLESSFNWYAKDGMHLRLTPL
jgi:hypothetical protein